MTYRPNHQMPGDVEAERRRRHLLANLSRRLNGLVAESDLRRGYGLQDAVAKLFRIEGIPWTAGYRRTETQIDGAIDLDGWYYLVEVRWRRRPASWADLDALRSKVRRSSRQTMGLFISMSGWTAGAADTLRSGGEQAILLVGQDDIARVLSSMTRLVDNLRAKARHLALYGEPYFSPPQDQ